MNNLMTINDGPTSEGSAVNTMFSFKAQMERMMNGGSYIDGSKVKQRTAPIIRDPGERMNVVRRVAALVDAGSSWEQATGEAGEGYNTTTIVQYAKKLGIYKNSLSHVQHAANRAKADEALPTIRQRLVGGMSMEDALAGTGIKEHAYRRAVERSHYVK